MLKRLVQAQKTQVVFILLRRADAHTLVQKVGYIVNSMAKKIAYLLIAVNMNEMVRSLTHPLNNYFKE